MKRTLGRSGIEVSALGMGCWYIGGLWQWLDGPGGWGEVEENAGAMLSALFTPEQMRQIEVLLGR